MKAIREGPRCYTETANQALPWIKCDLREYNNVVKSTVYPLKGWHLKHAEKAIVRFAAGLSEDASGFEKRNYRKYGTVGRCIRQIEYDMHHGAQRGEIVDIIRKIGRSKKYANIGQIRKLWDASRD
jgi:hypothetical protein